VYAEPAKFAKFFGRHRRGIHFHRDLRVRADLKFFANHRENSSRLFGRQKRRRSAAKIYRVDARSFSFSWPVRSSSFSWPRDLNNESFDIPFDAIRIAINVRRKIAVGTPRLTKRNMQINARSHTVTVSPRTSKTKD